jgi:hypothetical protein
LFLVAFDQRFVASFATKIVFYKSEEAIERKYNIPVHIDFIQGIGS